MNSQSHDFAKVPASPGFAQSFTPKLITTLREGYYLTNLRADAIAGLTVAIVAIPLSMAIAIASGAKPENGLFTAVVGGFLISALGGSRFQIGGPAGAFIVLVAKTIETYGFDGFLAATIMAGLILLAIGYMRLGGYIKYIPYSVTMGFTAGVALIIFASQIKDLLGLQVAHEPAAFLSKLETFWPALPTADPAAFGMAAASLAFIMILRIWLPRFPGLLAAIALAGFATFAFNLPLETIGSRFGGVPRMLPAPSFPHVPLAELVELIPAAIAIAMLGGIESLLSAVVADGMTGAITAPIANSSPRVTPISALHCLAACAARAPSRVRRRIFAQARMDPSRAFFIPCSCWLSWSSRRPSHPIFPSRRSPPF